MTVEPPQGLTFGGLWQRIHELEERVKHLEPHFWIKDKPPMCFCQETFGTATELGHHIHEYGRDD